MRKLILLLTVSFVFVSGLFISCKQSGSKQDKETILKGKVTILVDETVKPLIEDQIAVFESTYNAKITLVAKSEKELIQSFMKDTSGVVILSRPLDTTETKFFERFKIKPRVTKFATDAIAFISNAKDLDTLVALKDVVSFLKGDAQSKIKGLVFDNPNSSTVRYLTELAAVKEMPQKDVYSFKSNEEVVKFVAENEGMIGVVGVNWLLQPTSNIKNYLTNINVLNVEGLNKKSYFAPTQNNLAEGTYPLARDLFIINCQGTSGLGMGFASFLAGEIGQRIVLKSGMLPSAMPGRKILIKNRIK
ncbi:phosphate ABC transporter substrate-binding protein, PhoT family [Flavobacterium glycines]|uniref:Phosphate ABC transporter substrate-binding protein n=1 Tax=Flavobacterium glycines TaxID=551990 RepID=A0A1B9DN52_9FLAO|nr:substrate-binding domain-containing protein [Flavobacterium glycines]OCB71118.1 phosphate ABC transporter substrate-binding protein [Flavobacterium glycines]GEL10936.1 phosphate ABC transporter substrate-binding protein [Flavobacterium glycines]SDI48227.1 phosphate ABC transporter substrate-binding protein, PhoT family [Flavobacterium glycines]